MNYLHLTVIDFIANINFKCENEQENELETNTNTDKFEERVVCGCLESTGHVKLLMAP